MYFSNCLLVRKPRRREESLLKFKHQFRSLDGGIIQGYGRIAWKAKGKPQQCTVQGQDLAHWECRRGQVKWTQCPKGGQDRRSGHTWQFQ